MFIYADYYIAWVIHQQNLLFTYVSDLNLRNLQTSAHWEHISGGRVLNFISLGEKKKKLWGKIGEILLNSTMLYKFIQKSWHENLKCTLKIHDDNENVP